MSIEDEGLRDPETGEQLKKEAIAARLRSMTATPGWHIFSSYVSKQVRKCSDVGMIDTRSKDSVDIVAQVRTQQAKRDAYRGLLSYVQDKITKGEENGKRK